jgi:glycerol kinase
MNTESKAVRSKILTTTTVAWKIETRINFEGQYGRVGRQFSGFRMALELFKDAKGTEKLATS